MGSVRSARYRSVREGVLDDTGRMVAMAAGGAIAFAPVEYGLSLWAYAGPLSLASKLGFIALTVTLALVLWLALAVSGAAIVGGTRLIRAQLGDSGCARGWFDPVPVDPGTQVRPGVPLVWAATATALVLGAVLQRAAAWAVINYKEPQLTAVLIAGVGVGVIAAALPLYRTFAIATRVAGVALAPVLRVANPLGRWRAAGLALVALVAGGFIACWFVLPQSRSVLPIRLATSVAVIALGMGLGARSHARRAPRRLARRGAAGCALATATFITLTLAWWGADLETRYIVTPASALDRLIDVVRVANDVDRDGFGSLLGENDCAPFDRAIHPVAPERADDGIDQNCDGTDFSLREIALPGGTTQPVPEPFAKSDWNFLFLTIDTVRYDHTGFGGYATGPKRRDTTPRLDGLVRKSTSFAFAQAPSAGTMASIPAIITSKFFHSGIALDENLPPGNPPKLMPENTTLPEIMKRAGYYTGVIASHEYWNNWGLEQGVDEYDNSIGKTPDPFRVSANKVTDHVLAWVSRQQGKKWFLWAHYIDPHGRYVAHPDVVDYGTSEADLYDAELRWTDQEVGRLLDELARLPSASRTIVVITSDHGDSMAEHNVPLGTHGTALYRELIHVPLVFYIPENKPRVVGGAVSNLDIVPTIAELAGIDVRDLQFEGKSLVPQLFYGKEDQARVVFAETNAGGKQRAAISAQWKLVYYITTNLYELYDLTKDPWEHDNQATKNPTALAAMKQTLDAWLERVVYMRDPKFNQAYRQVADVTLTKAPAPPVRTEGQTLDAGRLEILGIGPETGKSPALKSKLDLHVYFRVKERPQRAYRFQLVVWPLGEGAAPTTLPPQTARNGPRPTADGFFATDKWRPGEYMRERFTITIPADWKASQVVVGLIAIDPTGQKVTPTGPAPTNDPTTAILGLLPLAPAAPAR